MKCQKKVAATGMHQVVTKNGRYMIKGRCPYSRNVVCQLVSGTARTSYKPVKGRKRLRKLDSATATDYVPMNLDDDVVDALLESKYDSQPETIDTTPIVRRMTGKRVRADVEDAAILPHVVKKTRRNPVRVSRLKRAPDALVDYNAGRRKRQRGSGIFGSVLSQIAGNALNSLIPF